MYEPFFGMNRRPFSATPDEGCFFSSNELQAVLDELTTCVERGQGIGILSAPAGLGKTLLCQRLAASFQQRDASKTQFACVSLSTANYPTRRSLLQAILFEMGDEYSRRDELELRITLRARLLGLKPEREALVLIVDEAHLSGDELLEELRTLADIAYNGSSLVRIILAGQHELEERLTDRSFDALNQRISNHVFIEPLTISESINYIAHRLDWAGCDIESAFTEEAVSIIARASGGVPRCLNQLSDHSLLLAYASEQKPVSEETVREALEDLKQLPLHWNDISDGTEVVGFVEGDDELSSDGEGTAEQGTGFVLDSGDTEDNLESASTVVTSSDHQNAAVDSSNTGENASLTDAETFEASSPPLDEEIEFDFSRDLETEVSGSETTAETDIDQPAASDPIQHDVTQKTSVFDFGFDQVTASDESETIDVDETLVQEIPAGNQETLFESAGIPAGNKTAGTANEDGSEDEDSGISFQITSNGFEVDGFDEIDSQPVQRTEENDSGVIEFAFDETLSDGSDDGETQPDRAVEPADDFTTEVEVSLVNADESVTVEGSIGIEEPETVTDPALSAADITVALLGPGSVLVEDSHDLAGSEGVEVSDDLSAESESIRSDISQEEVSNMPTVGSTRMFESDTDAVSPGGEALSKEEIVFDPYAVLQEPDGAGIVWDVVRDSDQPNAEASDAFEHAEISERVDDIADASANETSAIDDELPDGIVETAVTALDQTHNDVEESFDFAGDLVVDEGEADVKLASIDPTGMIFHDEADGEGETLDEESLKPDQLHDLSASETTTIELSEEHGLVSGDELDTELAADESNVFANGQILNTDASSDSVVDEEPVFELHSVESEEFDPVPEPVEDESEIVPQEHDVVEPVEARSPHPDLLTDSVLPLLNELNEELDPVTTSAKSAGRSIMDVEAELIQTIEHGSDDIEDEIGATMLDICLDTQSALQESAETLRTVDANEKAEHEDFEDFESDEELPALSIEPYDIVQPEPRSHEAELEVTSGLKFEELESEILQPETTSRSKTQPAEKPFGRLFSELRRRTR